MADANKSLFFAESDDEDVEKTVFQEVPMQELPATPPTESAAMEPPSRKGALFLPDSDEDEEFPVVLPQALQMNFGSSVLKDTIPDVEIPQSKYHRASSVSVASSDGRGIPRDSSPVSSVDMNAIPEHPNKKRRLSPEPDDTRTPFVSAYLGSFLVGNAWSTVHGKGYVKVRCESSYSRLNYSRTSMPEIAWRRNIH